MRIPVAVVAVLVGFVMPTNLALADTVNIGGTHSADEIRGKCAAAGGSFAVENSGAYSCVVTEKGTAVNCSANGKCRGTVPRGLGARGVKVFQGGGLKVVQDGVKVNQGGVKVFQGGGGQVYQGGGVKVIQGGVTASRSASAVPLRSSSVGARSSSAGVKSKRLRARR